MQKEKASGKKKEKLEFIDRTARTFCENFDTYLQINNQKNFIKKKELIALFSELFPGLKINIGRVSSKEQVAPKQLNVHNSSSVKKELIDGDFRILYNNCAFCRYCADNAYALDENSWFKFAVILSNLKDGFDIFDYYSKPYPEYSYQKTFDKFNNAKKYSMSCKTIAIDFEGCKNCENYKEENNYVY